MKLKDIKVGLTSTRTIIRGMHDAISEASYILNRRDLTTADVAEAQQRLTLLLQDLQLLDTQAQDASESIKMLETVYQQASGLLLAAFPATSMICGQRWIRVGESV